MQYCHVCKSQTMSGPPVVKQTAVLGVKRVNVQFTETILETPIKIVILLLMLLFTFSWQHDVVQINEWKLHGKCTMYMECYYLTVVIKFDSPVALIFTPGTNLLLYG